MSTDLLTYASKKYYEGNPIMSDAEFDFLADKYNFNQVGYHTDGIKHTNKLYSLQKYYDIASIPEYFNNYNIIKSPKLDGAAVSLYYLEGKLTLILTRGDGIKGKDVSRFLDVFPAPKNIPNKECLQITGELVAPNTIDRPRNYAAGALGLLDSAEFAKKDLTFIAYSVVPYIGTTYLQDMRLLIDYGFYSVVDYTWDNFPQDGVVFRVNSNKDYESLGYTAHHPKGAYAFKTRKEGVHTTLKDVIWQVGKSGAISPVAILEPVELDGVTISRATLHNIKYIEALDLEIGCTVEVIRAGEIIPRIIGKVEKNNS